MLFPRVHTRNNCLSTAAFVQSQLHHHTLPYSTRVHTSGETTRPNMFVFSMRGDWGRLLLLLTNPVTKNHSSIAWSPLPRLIESSVPTKVPLKIEAATLAFVRPSHMNTNKAQSGAANLKSFSDCIDRHAIKLKWFSNCVLDSPDSTHTYI
jgi:hypothetical protein